MNLPIYHKYDEMSFKIQPTEHDHHGNDELEVIRLAQGHLSISLAKTDSPGPMVSLLSS